MSRPMALDVFFFFARILSWTIFFVLDVGRFFVHNHPYLDLNVFIRTFVTLQRRLP